MPVLVHINKSEADLLRTTMEELLDAGQKARHTFWLGRAAEFLLMCIVFGIMLFIGIAVLLREPGTLAGCNPFDGIGSGWNTQPFSDPTATTRIESLRQAAKDGRTDLIGLCALYLTDINPAVRGAAQQALLVLLPRVQVTDWEQFTTSEKEALIKAIDIQETERTLVLLNALERVKEVSALSRVETFSAVLKHLPGKAKRNLTPMMARKLTEATETCLHSLRAQAELVKQSQTLLRASRLSEAITTDVLLRPAQSGNAANPDELLRSTYQSL